MSLEPKPLQAMELADTVTTMLVRQSTAAARVRQRLRDEMDLRGISQRRLTELINSRVPDNWTQSKLGKVLTGRVELRVEDMDLIASALGISLVEVVRDRGLEFVAELTPTELRLLERLRALSPDERGAILTILGIPSEADRAHVQHPRSSAPSGGQAPTTRPPLSKPPKGPRNRR